MMIDEVEDWVLILVKVLVWYFIFYRFYSIPRPPRARL